MKNVTVTLPEDLAKWVRIWAAKHEMSVSKMIAKMLSQKRQNDGGYEKSMEAFMTKKPHAFDHHSKYPKRDELYER